MAITTAGGNHVMRKQLIDQSLHLAWSILALSPLLYFGATWWAGALAGFLIGAPRELVDQWPVGHWKDTILDLAFFSLGGAIATLIWVYL